LAYLFNKNLQINTSARYLIEGKSQGIYSSLGISYRVNKHTDSYKDLNELKETPISRYNANKKGFFGRLFNIFKKKKGRKSARKKSKRKRN
jgi:hypothetical protein